MPDGLSIDTEGVRDWGHGLRADPGRGFGAAADRAAGLHRQGVGFGARLTPSDAVAAARQRYAYALANTEANVRAYQRAAEVLAQAAEDIARLFGASDLTAAQVQRTVGHLSDAAVRAATPTTGRAVP
jgi:hypothetical protein